MSSKGFVQEVKALDFPFDLDTEVTQPVKPPDLVLTKNIVIPMQGSITVGESIAIAQVGQGEINEAKVIEYVLIFLKSRSHSGWTIEKVKKLGAPLILKAFTAFSQEISATNTGVEVDDPEKKELPTGLPSTGDLEADTQATEDLTPTNSGIVL